MYARGQIAVAQGKLGDAEALLRRGLVLASQRLGYPLAGSADLHVGLADLAVERDGLVLAQTHLAESEGAGVAGMPQYASRKLVIAARIAQAEGDLGEAMLLLDQATRLHAPDFFPDTRPIAAMQARVSILRRDWAAVERWQRESGTTPDIPLNYRGEYDQITLVRFLLARRDMTAALQLLERLEPFAESGGRIGVVSELRLLRALALDALGQAPAAQATFRRSLEIGEATGRLRLYLDEGERIAALLRDAAKGKAAPAFARNLLARLGAPQRSRPIAHPELLEPLSDRELDVLKLLRGELSGPEIASELRVSLNTLRTHTKNIYDKLGVNSRRSAVRRAEELSLMQRL
jgi:LuxR family maltose regulon positive regulatory protein